MIFLLKAYAGFLRMPDFREKLSEMTEYQKSGV